MFAWKFLNDGFVWKVYSTQLETIKVSNFLKTPMGSTIN